MHFYECQMRLGRGIKTSHSLETCPHDITRWALLITPIQLEVSLARSYHWERLRPFCPVTCHFHLILPSCRFPVLSFPPLIAYLMWS